MILLDTNVVSAMMSPIPQKEVLNWLNKENTESLFLSTITIAEIGYGLYILPDGKRKKHLTDQFLSFVAQGFDQRILNFGQQAAQKYAEVMGHRRAIGRPLSVPDGQIASIARVNNFTVATRNIRDFEECGLSLINPF